MTQLISKIATDHPAIFFAVLNRSDRVGGGGPIMPEEGIDDVLSEEGGMTEVGGVGSTVEDDDAAADSSVDVALIP
jgi:hypothetical protein